MKEKKEILELLKRGPCSLNSLSPAHLSAAEELEDDGIIEKDGIGADGRMRYRAVSDPFHTSQPHIVRVQPPPNLYISPEQADWVRETLVRMTAGEHFAPSDFEDIRAFFVYIARMVHNLK